METLREHTVYSGQGLTVTVRESLELQTDKAGRRRFLVGYLKPVAIVIAEADRTTKYDIEVQSAG